MTGQMANGEGGATSRGLSDEERLALYASLMDAYYPRLVVAPGEARARAQLAYTLTVGVIVGLLSAGLLGSLSEASWTLKILSAADLGLWVTASCVYLYAIASPVKKPTGGQAPEGGEVAVEDWPEHVLQAAATERDEIDARQRIANWISGGAAVLALAAFVIILLGSKPAEVVTKDGIVLLTNRGSSALEELCGGPPNSLRGAIREDAGRGSLSIALVDDDQDCKLGGSEIHLSKEYVAAVVLDKVP